jgi:hypothetical protein
MELLQNYRARKQLDILQEPREADAIEDMIDERISQALRDAFWMEPLFPRSTAQRSARSSLIKSSEPVSPRQRSQSQSLSNQSVKELLSIVDGLESRVDYLEDRNQQMSQSLEEAQSELISIRELNACLKSENDHLSSQVRSLKAVVSSESSAGKVLERVSHTDQLEFKLEIYRQQISVLNEEINKLRNNSQ